MQKSPAFQFYAADYLADANVQRMTIEEEGVYFRLICYCWREGSLPNDDHELSLLCKGADISSMPRVKACFEVSKENATLLVHRRLKKEKKKQNKYRSQWRQRQKNHRVKKESCHADVTHVSRSSVTPESLHSSSLSSSSSSTSVKTNTERETYAEISFSKFYKKYPRQKDEQRCKRMWFGLSPIDQAAAIDSLDIWIPSEEWRDSGGRYIPSSVTFLESRGWDSKPLQKIKTESFFDKARRMEREAGVV